VGLLDWSLIDYSVERTMQCFFFTAPWSSTVGRGIGDTEKSSAKPAGQDKAGSKRSAWLDRCEHRLINLLCQLQLTIRQAQLIHISVSSYTDLECKATRTDNRPHILQILCSDGISHAESHPNSKANWMTRVITELHFPTVKLHESTTPTVM